MDFRSASCLIAFVVTTALFFQARGQNVQSARTLPSTVYSLPKSNLDLDRWYDSLTGLSKYNLFNGIDYVYPPALREGHPFLGSESWQKGAVVIDGSVYSDVLMRYDLTIDAVIVYDESKGRSIQLHFAEGFMINTSKFKSINTGVRLTPAYYQVIVEDNLSLLVRREKKPYKSYYDTKVVTVYEPSIKYYIQFNDEAYSFKGKSTISKLFPQFKKDIEAYIKASKLKVRDSRLDDMISIIKYSNQLIQRSTYNASID